MRKPLWAAGVLRENGGVGMNDGPDPSRDSIVNRMSDGEVLVECTTEFTTRIVGVMRDGKIVTE